MKIQWIDWMTDAPTFEFNSSTAFADIIVPTIDTIRTSYLCELLVKSKKQVSILQHLNFVQSHLSRY